jgi:hypothetical protein
MLPPEPLEILFHPCAAEVVEQDDFVAVGQEPICQICADETDTTCNKYAHFDIPNRYPRYFRYAAYHHIDSAKAYLILPESD